MCSDRPRSAPFHAARSEVAWITWNTGTPGASSGEASPARPEKAVALTMAAGASPGSVDRSHSAAAVSLRLGRNIPTACTSSASNARISAATEAVSDAERAGLPVEIDARHVTFMDSSGVSMLARLAHRTPGRLTMIEPPDVVRFLLEVTRIGEVIDVLDTDPGFPEDPTPTDAA